VNEEKYVARLKKELQLTEEDAVRAVSFLRGLIEHIISDEIKAYEARK
jgi:hypothetical protein